MGAAVALGVGVGVPEAGLAFRLSSVTSPCIQKAVSDAGKPPMVKVTVLPAKLSPSGSTNSTG